MKSFNFYPYSISNRETYTLSIDNVENVIAKYFPINELPNVELTAKLVKSRFRNYDTEVVNPMYEIKDGKTIITFEIHGKNIKAICARDIEKYRNDEYYYATLQDSDAGFRFEYLLLEDLKTILTTENCELPF